MWNWEGRQGRKSYFDSEAHIPLYVYAFYTADRSSGLLRDLNSRGGGSSPSCYPNGQELLGQQQPQVRSRGSCIITAPTCVYWIRAKASNAESDLWSYDHKTVNRNGSVIKNGNIWEGRPEIVLARAGTIS